MNPILLELLRRDLQQGLPSFAGAEAYAVVPITDAFLSAVIARSLPPNGAVREVTLRAEDGDRLAVKVTLARPSFLPPIPVTLVIHEQPHLPERPVLVLKLSLARAVMGLALKALQAAPLPPGVSVEEDHINVDIARLLAERGLTELLEYVSELHVHTRPGAVVVSLRSQIGPR
ncbi:MAG TPA: hypothetical protein VFJ02_01515 [Vicinamibacterales bacterium]|nr:hypothetical protein [Vicinamibacterales bacterium]